MSNLTPDDAGWYLDEYDAERFWAHVNFHGGTEYKSDPIATAEGECWLWNGANTEADYGRFRVFGIWQSAHRTAYKDFGHKLSDDLDVDHLCRIHPCVNPAHLEAVTHQVNMSRGIRAKATHCKNGHEFTEENTKLIIKGENTTRHCRACRKAYARNLYLRRKNAA